MRAIFILSLSLFFAFSTKAQTGTDLEFSRVYNATLDSWLAEGSIGTVPAGKVWKLTGFSLYCNNCHMEIQLANQQTVHLQTRSNYEVKGKANLPIWFNEGDELYLYTSGSPWGADGSTPYISFIEYTVIP